MTLHADLQDFFKKAVRNKHLKYGLPFFVFMGIGLTVVSDCATVRYDFRQGKILDREEIKNLGFKIGERPETLEEAYEKYKEVDIDNWENKRGPRLWDDTPPE